MRKLFLLNLLLFFSIEALAVDYDNLCVEAILHAASPDLRRNNQYLSDHRAMISYTYYGNEKTQEVYTDTGRAFTDVPQNQFLCTKASNNPERSLSNRVDVIFAEIYASKPNTQARNQYSAAVFPSCNRSSFTELKIRMAQIRSVGDSGVDAGLNRSLGD